VSNITNVNSSSEFRITINGDGESLDLFSCSFQREKGKRKTETVNNTTKEQKKKQKLRSEKKKEKYWEIEGKPNRGKEEE
jgi:hypothetical protein